MSNRPLTATVGTCLVAGTIGAGVALLFAPHSGIKTRRLIRRKAEQCIEEAKADMAERTEELYLRGKQAAENTARKLRRKLNLAA
jgi:gas vesicle protein